MEFKQFIDDIGQEDKIAVLHHTDPDGVCSGVIISKLIERIRGKKIDLRLNQGQNELHITQSTINAIKQNNINKLIVTDMAVDQNIEPFKQLDIDILILDHHKLYNDINSNKIVLIKPQLIMKIKDPSVYCAAKLCYDLSLQVADMKDLDWVAAIGVIGDCTYDYWKDFLLQVFRKYNIPMEEDVFHTKLGKCAELLSYAESYDINKVKYCFDLVYRSSNYLNILTSELNDYKEEIKEEINKHVELLPTKAEFYNDINLIFYVIQPKFSVKSNLSTILSFKYPKQTLIIVDTSKERATISARRRDKKVAVNELLEKAVKDIEGARAGGHIPAAGGSLLRKDVNLLKKNVVEILKSKNRIKNLGMDKWKKITDKFSIILQTNIKTSDNEGNVLVESGKQPFFCELVERKSEICKRCRKNNFEKNGKFKCVCGLGNIALPMIMKSTQIGSLIIGPFKQTDIFSFKEIAEEINVAEEELVDAYSNINNEKEFKHELLDMLSNTLPELVFQKSITEKKNVELEIINRISSLINSTLNLDDIFNQIISFMVSFSQLCSILIYESNKRYMTKMLPASYKNFENIIAQKILQHGNAVLVEDIINHHQFENSGINMYKSLVSIPIKSVNKIIGIISLYTNDITEIKSKLNFLKIVSNQAALAITNAQQYEKIKDMAVTDKLTGFFNRRKFVSILDSEIKRSGRLKNPISIAMVDVDHFSNYNNTHGHPAGDKILMRLSDVMRNNVREIDTIGRYGGEEFIVIFPETKPKEIHMIAERLVNAVAEEPFDLRETQPLGKITISMGLLTVMDGSMSASEMIKEADRALYKAKERGRNRVVNTVVLNKNMRPIDVN